MALWYNIPISYQSPHENAEIRCSSQTMYRCTYVQTKLFKLNAKCRDKFKLFSINQAQLYQYSSIYIISFN